MNNIAVVLRGHYRTWGYVHPAVFDFYDKIAENVDYYIVTWRYPNQSAISFTEPFKKYKKNLVKFLTVYPDDAYYTSYLGASYLSYQIIPDMLVNHHKNKYDFVFNTRPDIIYKARDNSPKLTFKQDTLYTSGYVCQPDGRPDSTHHIGVEDHFFASSFENNLIMNTRHYEIETMGCHNQILHHATQYGIKTAALYNMFARIVRPTAFRECRNPLEYFDVDNFAISLKWTTMEKENKLKVLKKYGIPEQDYITNSILAKI
jgi:hypothetical protein